MSRRTSTTSAPSAVRSPREGWASCPREAWTSANVRSRGETVIAAEHSVTASFDWSGYEAQIQLFWGQTLFFLSLNYPSRDTDDDRRVHGIILSIYYLINNCLVSLSSSQVIQAPWQEVWAHHNDSAQKSKYGSNFHTGGRLQKSIGARDEEKNERKNYFSFHYALKEKSWNMENKVNSLVSQIQSAERAARSSGLCRYVILSISASTNAAATSWYWRLHCVYELKEKKCLCFTSSSARGTLLRQ